MTTVVLRKGTYKCLDCGHKTRRQEGSTAVCVSCGAETGAFGPAKLTKRVRITPIKTSVPVVRHLVELVDAAGLSRNDLWKTVGVATNGLTMWRTGKSEPSLRSIEAVADYLGYELKLMKKESNK